MTRRLPWSLAQNPRLDRWVDFSSPGVVRVFTAKVEIGQGILTAMAQIAAEALELGLDQIAVVSGDTRWCPNESYTSGSMSIEIGGTSLRIACAQARAMLIERAARRLGVAADRITVARGDLTLDGAATGLSYWSLAPEVDWTRPAAPEADEPLLDWPHVRAIGTSAARLDLPAKITGAAFIHDFEIPGMLHGRVLRPPHAGARLEALDSSSAQRLPGVVRVVRSGDFVAVCCEREYQAVKALEALRKGSRWGGRESSAVNQNWREWLPTLRSIDSQTETGSPPFDGGMRALDAIYSRPPLAHASMAPSCALALFEGDRLRVWTHSQGVFPLRGALAGALKMAEESIAVTHIPGAGVYGHNGADDAALDAALLAREVPGRTVRVQWMRDDEMAWSPLGSPMVMKLSAKLGPSGAIASWATEIWSGPHGQRPFSRNAVNLLAASHTDPPIAAPEVYETLGGFAGGARNADPAYELPHRRLVLHSLPGLPFRTSALRTLGGYANVFATESFMDELADLAAVDPVEFRLRHLSDPRARGVIETAARRAGWRVDAPRAAGEALGIGFCRYKNSAAYVAVVARVAAGADIRVLKVDCAVDCGLAINPDGVLNQIEGGIVQSISWTLKERVTFDGPRITTRSWSEYPILRFDEVPELDVQLIEQPQCPPLGVGEAAQGPAAAAVANAAARALGVRVRDLPITRERVIAAGA